MKKNSLLTKNISKKLLTNKGVVMWKKVLTLLPMVLERLPLAPAKRVLVKTLDAIKEEVLLSDNKIDDFLILPIIEELKSLLKMDDK